MLRDEERRPGRGRADLLQEALKIGPHGPSRGESAQTIALGLASGDAGRAATVLRRLAGPDRGPLERLLVLLGSAIAAEAGLAGRLAWTLDADANGTRLLDLHGATRAVLSLLVPGWADPAGTGQEAGRALVPRAGPPPPDTAHGRAARRLLLHQDLAALGLSQDLPRRLGIAHHLDGGADGRGNPMPPAAPPKRAPLP